MDALKIAVMSDVHGNLPALDAVLADAEAEGVQQYWIIGDLVAHGPRSAEVLHRLTALPRARFVRGNTDRYVLTGEFPARVPTAETARTPEDVALLVDVSSSFAWTRGALSATDFLPWLASLPVEIRIELPDGTRVLLVHAAPGHDDGPGLAPTHTEDEIRAAIARAEAELIFVGHTHQPMDRIVDGVRVVNDGSVSLPATDDRRACWTLITANEQGHTIQPRRVGYDLAGVRADLDRVRHPSARYLQERLRETVT